MKALCIYHGGCDDGFAAAWAVRAALGDQVEFYPGVYQQDPPDVAGRDVIMVDFSYKRPVIEAMAESARTILILDHHKTAQDDLAPFTSVPGLSSIAEEWGRSKQGDDTARRVNALFDMNRSGATIAWDFFHPGQPRPGFLNYIEDRDLWRKQLTGGDEFSIALRSYPQDFKVWDELIACHPLDLIGQGEHIQRYYRRRVEELKASAYPALFAGHQVMVANAPYFAASEVAGELAEGNPFGACYFERGAGLWQYSLRSRDGGVDVSEIAKQFGGGGHRDAAGFTVPAPVHQPIWTNAA